MHQTILVKRRAEAVARLTSRSEAMIKHLELDPTLLDGLHPPGIKDSQAREMMFLEGLALFMDAIAELAGVPNVTAVTPESEPEPQAEPETAPSDEAPAELSASNEDIGADGLPAPTLEEVLAESPTSETEAETTEAPMEEPTVTEDEPTAVASEVDPPADEESAAAETEETEPVNVIAEEPAPEVIEELEPPTKPKRKSRSKK